MACRTGCLTQDHSSWGECAKAAALRIGYAASAKGLDLTAQKKQDRELQAYRDARSAGIQPDSTRLPSVQKAVELSEKHGKPYGAN
jgi:hypothetical protein